MKLILHSKYNEFSDVMTFRFTPPPGFTWQAGQYMHYVLEHENVDDRGTERWFTNAAAPHEGFIQITTRIASEHGSSFKAALQRLEVGDSIEADGPEGDFVIDDPSKDYVFIAGGIGITPLRSILADLNHRQQPINVRLLYASRTPDFVFKDELESIAANSNLRITYVVSPERIDAEKIKQAAQGMQDPTFYLSGPEPMVKGLADEMKQAGFKEEDIKLDDFPGYEWPGG